MEYKKCCRCKLIKSIDLFYKNKLKKDGHEYFCKTCDNLRHKEYLINHKEKVILRRQKYRIEHKEQIKQWIKKSLLKYKQNKPEQFNQMINKNNFKYYHNPKNSIKNIARQKARIVKITSHTVCSKCSSKEHLHRHHTDYTKPLDVVILCRNCHFKEHSI